MQRIISMRSGLIAGIAVLMLLVGVPAQAATRDMVGSVSVINPSVSAPNFFEVGPYLFGKAQGGYAPDAGFKTIMVTGASASTAVGRQITLTPNQLAFSGFQQRLFPTFANVGNGQKIYQSSHPAATFMNGGGALASCPGNGCTSNGAGTAISWCPPLAEAATNPAPGTPSNTAGNWDCAGWLAGVLGGDRFLQIAISNPGGAGANHYGGTFSLLRNTVQDNYNNSVLPSVFPGTGVATRNWRRHVGVAWPGGQPNFQYNASPGNAGPQLQVTFATPGGFITGTNGCVNPGGTPGGVFSSNSAIGAFGSNCGTPPPPGGQQEWGFKMTTGSISGSDPYPGSPGPFGRVVTTAVPPGTPFAPNVNTRAASLGFFFTRMGGDTVMGTHRNLVLLGGGVAIDPISGNAFYRLTELRFQMQVPEPTMALGLGAGIVGLAALARRRRSS